MAKENSTTQVVNETANNSGNNHNSGGVDMFGDMMVLRDIIMGPKITEYNIRFADIDSNIKKLEESTLQNIAIIEKGLKEHIHNLELLIMQNADHLNKKIEQTSKQDRAQLADFLVEVAKKLKE